MNNLQLYSNPSKQISLLDPRDLLTVWISHLQLRVKAQELSADTANGYQRGAERFLDWLKDKAPTSEAIRRWKAELLEEKYKPAAINAWLAGVRSFFKWLAET